MFCSRRHTMQDRGRYGDGRADQNIYRQAELGRPVSAIESDEKSRDEEKHRHLADMQPAPVRGVNQASFRGWLAPQVSSCAK